MLPELLEKLFGEEMLDMFGGPLEDEPPPPEPEGPEVEGPPPAPSKAEVESGASQAAQVTMRLCESRERRQIRLPLMS